MFVRRLRLAAILLALLISPAIRALESSCPQASGVSVYSGATLRVLSLNIAHGRGTALNQMLVSAEGTRENLSQVAAMLEKYHPDVVGLQEADAASRWSGNFDHVQWLGERNGYACRLHGVHAESSLYRFGTALLSKLQLHNVIVHKFEPTPPTTDKGFVLGRVNWREGQQERQVGLVSVHLDFSRKSVRRAQIAALLAAVRARETPLVVMGDFNAGWNREDSVVRRLVLDGGLVAWQPEADDLGTYKRKRLDWILVTPDLQFLHYETAEEVVSDHRAVVADIGWAAGATE